MADWGTLPELVLGLIASRLPLIEDVIAFRATCSSWLKGTPLKGTSCHKLPLLMLSWTEGKHAANEREFFSLSRGKTCMISLPEANGMECIGSKGWLIMVERSTGNMCLFHPLTRAHIPLPKLLPQGNIPVLPREFVSAALSASPSETSDFVVVVAYEERGYVGGRYTGFWKPGYQTWTKVEIPRCVEHLNYYNGKFYALTWGGEEVWMCNVSGPNPNNKASKTTELPWVSERPKAQLVESGGRLLVVAPFVCDPMGYGYYEYDLQMVEIDVIKHSYNTITSLGSATIFIGHNEGLSIDANRFPGIIEPNSIYFSDGSYQVATPGPNHMSKPNYGSGVWVNV